MSNDFDYDYEGYLPCLLFYKDSNSIESVKVFRTFFYRGKVKQEYLTPQEEKIILHTKLWKVLYEQET